MFSNAETPELLRPVFGELDQASFLQAYQVSTAWSATFNNSYFVNWKKRIEKDFYIKEEIFNQFSPALVFEDKAFYKKIYKRLFSLVNQTNYATYLTFERILQDESKHFMLIACCSDIPEHLTEIMFREERELCLKIALFAKCNNIVKALLPKDKRDLMLFFQNALVAGNLEIKKYFVGNGLLKNNHDYPEFMSSFAICTAARSGDVDMFKSFVISDFFCENDKEYFPKILHTASQSGSVKLVSYLLDPDNKLNFELDKETLLGAIQSGNMKLISYLFALNDKREEKIILSSKDVASVFALSGNTQIIPFLESAKLDWKPDFSTDVIIKSIEHSGNWVMVMTLMGFQDNQNQLNCGSGYSFNLASCAYLQKAIAVGHRNLISYFIDYLDQFGMRLDYTDLAMANESGFFESVLYLLDPRNNIHLTANEPWDIFFPDNDNVNDIVKYIQMDAHNKLRGNTETAHLVPKFTFEFQTPVDELAVIIMNMNSTQHLFVSHFLITNQLIPFDEEVNEEVIMKDNENTVSILAVIYLNSPLYFYCWVDHILTNPNYRSNTHLLDSVKSLLNVLESMQTPLQRQRHRLCAPQQVEYVAEKVSAMRI